MTDVHEKVQSGIGNSYVSVDYYDFDPGRIFIRVVNAELEPEGVTLPLTTEQIKQLALLAARAGHESEYDTRALLEEVEQ